MQELEKILKTVDSGERLRRLLGYARLLGCDVDAARNEEGELIENRLILLVYDGEEALKRQKDEGVGVWFGSILLSFALLVVIWVISLLLTKL